MFCEIETEIINFFHLLHYICNTRDFPLNIALTSSHRYYSPIFDKIKEIFLFPMMLSFIV